MTGTSASEVPGERPVSAFAHGYLAPTAPWLTNCDSGASADVVKSTVEVDVVRILREVVPLPRIKRVKFGVLKGVQVRLRA